MTRNSSRVLPPEDAPKPKIKKRKLIPGRVRAAQRLEKNQNRVNALFPDAPPEDMALFRHHMARRISMLVGNVKECWRSCPEPICRRMRCCGAPHVYCSNLESPPLTEEQEARGKALIRRAAEDAAVRLEAEEAAR